VQLLKKCFTINNSQIFYAQVFVQRIIPLGFPIARAFNRNNSPTLLFRYLKNAFLEFGRKNADIKKFTRKKIYKFLFSCHTGPIHPRVLKNIFLHYRKQESILLF